MLTLKSLFKIFYIIIHKSIQGLVYALCFVAHFAVIVLSAYLLFELTRQGLHLIFPSSQSYLVEAGFILLLGWVPFLAFTNAGQNILLTYLHYSTIVYAPALWFGYYNYDDIF